MGLWLLAVIFNCHSKWKRWTIHKTTFAMTIILGGGIGGLSAAYYHLKKFGTRKNVKLFEASSRFGGWIQTDTSRADRNVRFEYGPRTLRTFGERGFNTIELCDELNLNNDLLPITSSHPAAKNRMIAVNNQLYSLPSSLLSIFRTAPPFKKPLVWYISQDLRSKYKGEKLADDSMYNFVERRFGTDIATYLISSMVCGICAGDAKEISVKFLMKTFFEYEQEHGNITKGLLNKLFSAQKQSQATSSNPLVGRARKEKWNIYSMANGMEQLPKALVSHLTQNYVQMNSTSKCDSIRFGDDHSIAMTINEQTHHTDLLISSLPAFEMSHLLQSQHPTLAQLLGQIPYVDVAVINFHFANDLLPSPGFGFLVPPTENLPILGVIYDSSCFKMGDNNTVLTVMMGGKWFRSRLGDNISEAELLEKALQSLRSILKIDQSPVDYRVNVLRKCIPQYVVGHHDRIKRILDYIAANNLPMKLCGSAIDGVGVNDVIFSAKHAVQSIESGQQWLYYLLWKFCSAEKKIK